MAFAGRLRFVDSASVLRLDLNDATGFQTGAGFNLGTADLSHSFLIHSGVNGGVMVGDARPPIQMVIPVILAKQASWAAMAAKMEALRVELDRPTNIVEFRPTGASTSFLIDTYRSPMPSLFRGQANAIVAEYLADTEPMELVIWRHPISRGAGAWI